jgi:hypothetical protein
METRGWVGFVEGVRDIVSKVEGHVGFGVTIPGITELQLLTRHFAIRSSVAVLILNAHQLIDLVPYRDFYQVLHIQFEFWRKLLHHSVARSPCLNLLLAQLSQLVNCRRATSHDTLCNVQGSSWHTLSDYGICCRFGLDPDDTNTWILWAAVVLSITKVSKPCLKAGRVVFSDSLAVCDNVCFP